MLRILLDILIFASIFYFSWWVTLVFVIIGILSFKNFYESIVAGLFFDLLYGTPAVEFSGIWFVYTMAFSAIYFLCEKKLKKNLRFYEAL